MEARVDPCHSGLHACRRADLPLWMGKRLYEIELDGEVREEGTKLVASRARLLRRIEEWDDATRDAYTRMCADQALELASSVSPPLEHWAAVIEPSVPEGPALLGFVAARIAEEIVGPEGYRVERERQATWLAHRLGLDATRETPATRASRWRWRRR